MRSSFRVILLCLCLFRIGQLDAQGIKPKLRALSVWNEGQIREGYSRYSSMWGYVDSASGANYAILGGVDSLYFLSISADGKSIAVCDAVRSGASGCLNREFKTYRHYAYAVSDQCTGGSLEIFDLQYLPDSVHRISSTTEIIRDAHALQIWEDKVYFSGPTQIINVGGINTTTFPVLVVASLKNPDKPVLLQSYTTSKYPFFPDYIHDLFVRGDTVWASSGPGGLHIIDCRINGAPKPIQSITLYPDQGYNHSGALSADGTTFYFTDENNGARIKAFDVSDITQRRGTDYHFLNAFGIAYGQGAIAHNVFVKDHHLWASYYHEGVAVFDIARPGKEKLIAHFDTYPQNDYLEPDDKYRGFNGVWNLFPYYKNNLCAAGDMTNGLVVLSLDTITGIQPEKYAPGEARPYFSGDYLITPAGSEITNPAIYSMEGKLLRKLSTLQGGQFTFPIGDLVPAVYILKYSDGKRVTRSIKLVKTQ